MKKRAELVAAINALRTKVTDLLAKNDLPAAKDASDKLQAKMQELEALDKDSGKSEDNGNFKPISNISGGSKMDRKEHLKKVSAAVNTYLRRGYQALDEAGRNLVKPLNATDSPGQVGNVDARGGVLVPVETADFVLRQSTGVYRLRERVQERFTSFRSGTIPLMENPTTGLVAQFDEFPSGGIQKGQVTFGSVNYAVKDYGLIIPVSRDLLQDASVDVFAELMEQFLRAQVVSENAFILAALDEANAAPEAVSDWRGILKALTKTTPIGATDKVIVTNSDGWNYLDTLTDEQGRPILTQALVDNPRRYFRGYEVIQIPDSQLPTATPAEGADYGAIPFYVGSLYDAVIMIERQGLEVSYNPYSDSAYAKNAVDVRITCRLDTKSKFADAMKKVTYTPAND